MNLSEINWDFNAAGTWPLQIKAAFVGLACCIVIGAGYYFLTIDQLAALDELEKKEQDLISEFETKQSRAVNLEAYRKQLKEIEALLAGMLKQMPTKAEVAALLTDIAHTETEIGLESKLFQPEAEVPKEFYIELPYSIDVVGKYEELGLFISGLAQMPRIVTVHDINIEPLSGRKEDDGRLELSATIKTYTEVVAEKSADQGAAK